MKTATAQTAAKSRFRTEQPFSHIIVFEWHDGPVKGLARNALSDHVYYLTMLDGDEALEKRVFAAYEVEHSLYDDCLRVLSEIEKPRYPLWSPPVVPGQIDFRQWSRTERSRLAALLGCSRYVDRVLGVREVEPDSAVDVTEWDFDEETHGHCWAKQLCGTTDQ